MATTARKRGPSAVQRGTTFPVGVAQRLTAIWRSFRASPPDLIGTPRFRREFVGVVLVLLAMLSAYVIGRGGDEGRFVAWWGENLQRSFGKAALMVPLLLALAALRAFGGQSGRILEARHYLGGFTFAVAVAGLLDLGDRTLTAAPGGALGMSIATLSHRILGPFGGGLVLFAIGVMGIFLLAGSDLQTFSNDVRDLFTVIWTGIVMVTAAIVAVVRNFVAAVRRYEQKAAAVAPAAGMTTGAASPGAIPVVARNIVAGVGTGNASTGGKASKAAPAPAEATAVPVAAPAKALAVKPKPIQPPVINVPPRKTQQAVADSGRSAARVTPLPLPDLSSLAYYDDVTPDTADLQLKARLIEETLASFKVEAWVREINPGPAVTQFALEPGNGVKVSRITALQSDLALALAAPSIRIEAPIPGYARVGLETPNAQIATVGLRETLESSTFGKGKHKLPIPLGRDVNGRYVVGDLTKMPHLLIAGATGAGKSVCLNGIISTFIATRSPEELKLLMIDPKMVELTGYNGVPHLQTPVVTDMDKVVGALRLTLREMERRYTLFSKLGVRNLDGYRLKVAEEPGAENLPYLVVIIDELADLMMTAPDDVETLLVRLAQMARATGIHLIIATQRPSVDVLTGLIKANVPSRIAFAVSSLTDSRVILDMPGAERLLGRGDMLFLPPDAAKPQRIQGAFIEDKDVQSIVEHWHKHAPVPRFAEEWLDLPAAGGSAGGDDGLDADDDPLFDQALSIVRQQGTASASMLQRRLRVGYNRAARLIERMEDEGIIGAADGIRGRPVLLAEDYGT
ncbi:MAG: DNA translocase FtsK [Chloroflexota bacterium]|nr:DNA translocase FtsK [Chloroflexota bacterium]